MFENITLAHDDGKQIFIHCTLAVYRRVILGCKLYYLYVEYL